MRTFIHIFFMNALLIGFCSGSELPNDVERLLSKRHEAVAKIDRILVKELEKLKVKYTKAADLESANKIQDLINEVKPPEEHAQFKIDGFWQYEIPGNPRTVVREFDEGALIDEGGTARPYTEEDGVLTIRWGGNLFEKLTIDPAKPNVIHGVNHEGTRFTYTRLKTEKNE